MAPLVEAESAIGGFAKRLKEFREASGRTQQEMADALGISRSYLSDVEILRAKPSADVIYRALDLPFDKNAAEGGRLVREWLLFGEGNMLGEAGVLAPGTFPAKETDHNDASWFRRVDDLREVFTIYLPIVEDAAGSRLVRKSALRAVRLLCERLFHQKYVRNSVDGVPVAFPDVEQFARTLGELLRAGE